MAPITLQGKLVSADVLFREPDIGTAVFVSAIDVPEVLQTRAFYETEISISTCDETIEFPTDVVIEPAHTNAIGQKRERAIAFVVSRYMSGRALDGAEIRLEINPEPKLASEQLVRFKEAMGSKGGAWSD